MSGGAVFELGIKKYNKKVKRIIGVGEVSDRTKNIRSYFGLEIYYDFEYIN